MLLWILVKLGLKKKPKALRILEEVLRRACINNERVGRSLTKAMTNLYWYEVIFKNSVFKRLPIDKYNPKERFEPIFALMERGLKYAANIDVIDEAKIKLMRIGSKDDITTNYINENYTAKTNLLDDIVTEKEADKTSGRWGG